MAPKVPFSYLFLDEPLLCQQLKLGGKRVGALCEKSTLFLSAFPMFVPSLSWQSDHLCIYEGGKKIVFLPASSAFSAGPRLLDALRSRRFPAETPLFQPFPFAARACLGKSFSELWRENGPTNVVAAPVSGAIELCQGLAKAGRSAARPLQLVAAECATVELDGGAIKGDVDVFLVRI